MIYSTIRSTMLMGALALAALAPSLVAEHVAGDWNMNIELDASSGSAFLRLQQDGDVLTGSYQGLLGRAPVEGTIIRGEIVFRVGSGASAITYTGTVSNGTMTGACDYAGAETCTFLGLRSES